MRLFLIVLLFVSCSINAQVYKWTDESGAVHFSSEPRGNNKNSESVEIGPTNSGTIITERQKKMTTVLESDREMEQAFQQIQRGGQRSSESGSCKLYRVWLEDEKSELESLRRRGYTIDEEQYQERQVEEAKRRVNAFC